ncbi:30S ribosomal protein S4 [bacterium]|nr:30S ribosomal protein S4 [bacterium]MCI0565709.1 30S ribosomal protein S4 [bacterium]MCI0679976.1 30S ribosomal protein S4 [bacterium]
MTSHGTCRTCRGAGEKLFLKGEKCFSPKCVFNKRPTGPGNASSLGKRRAPKSEYGIQLAEKQKARNIYGVGETQFVRYIKEATSKKGSLATATLYANLETRLDNVVFRLGFAKSRPMARQLVSHGHTTVNGRKVTVPSYRLHVGDIIGIRPGSVEKGPFREPNEEDHKKKDSSVPSWLFFNPDKREAEVKTTPQLKDKDASFDITAIMEFYSR